MKALESHAYTWVLPSPVLNLSIWFLEELDLTVPKIPNCTRSNVMPTYSRG